MATLGCSGNEGHHYRHKYPASVLLAFTSPQPLRKKPFSVCASWNPEPPSRPQHVPLRCPDIEPMEADDAHYIVFLLPHPSQIWAEAGAMQANGRVFPGRRHKFARTQDLQWVESVAPLNPDPLPPQRRRQLSIQLIADTAAEVETVPETTSKPMPDPAGPQQQPPTSELELRRKRRRVALAPTVYHRWSGPEQAPFAQTCGEHGALPAPAPRPHDQCGQTGGSWQSPSTSPRCTMAPDTSGLRTALPEVSSTTTPAHVPQAETRSKIDLDLSLEEPQVVVAYSQAKPHSGMGPNGSQGGLSDKSTEDPSVAKNIHTANSSTPADISMTTRHALLAPDTSNLSVLAAESTPPQSPEGVPRRSFSHSPVDPELDVDRDASLNPESVAGAGPGLTPVRGFTVPRLTGTLHGTHQRPNPTTLADPSAPEDAFPTSYTGCGSITSTSPQSDVRLPSQPLRFKITPALLSVEEVVTHTMQLLPARYRGNLPISSRFGGIEANAPGAPAPHFDVLGVVHHLGPVHAVPLPAWKTGGLTTTDVGHTRQKEDVAELVLMDSSGIMLSVELHGRLARQSAGESNQSQVFPPLDSHSHSHSDSTKTESYHTTSAGSPCHGGITVDESAAISQSWASAAGKNTTTVAAGASVPSASELTLGLLDTAPVPISAVFPDELRAQDRGNFSRPTRGGGAAAPKQTTWPQRLERGDVVYLSHLSLRAIHPQKQAGQWVWDGIVAVAQVGFRPDAGAGLGFRNGRGNGFGPNLTVGPAGRRPLPSPGSTIELCYRATAGMSFDPDLAQLDARYARVLALVQSSERLKLRH